MPRSVDKAEDAFKEEVCFVFVFEEDFEVFEEEEAFAEPVVRVFFPTIFHGAPPSPSMVGEPAIDRNDCSEQEAGNLRSPPLEG